MSHLTTYKNNCLDKTQRELLISSLAELSISLDFTCKEIKNTWIKANVDAAFVCDGKIISAGIVFEKNEDGTEKAKVVGDFYGTGYNDKEIIDKISQIYQKNDIVEKCKSLRWFIDENEDITTKENGDIVIRATRYA